MEPENVGVVQAYPQQYPLTKPLYLIVNPRRSAAEETRYPCYITSIIIWSKPQRLDRDLSSIPYPFPQVGIPTRCKGNLFMRL